MRPARPSTKPGPGGRVRPRGRCAREGEPVKITAVKTAATSGHCMHLWVRVETDAGVTGLGECVHGGYQAIAIIHDLAPRLIGRDPFAIDAIFEETRRSLVFE